MVALQTICSYVRSLYFPSNFSLDERVPFRGKVRQKMKMWSYFCCLPIQGGNLIIGQASKPKKAHGKIALVDLESDIDVKNASPFLTSLELHRRISFARRSFE